MPRIYFFLLTTTTLFLMGCTDTSNQVEASGDDISTIEEVHSLAAAGDINAQYLLGEYYLRESSPIDYEAAFDWYLKAAEQENTSAQFMLGAIYVDGIGIEKDIDKGMEWLLMAANGGFIDSQYAVGQIYQYGDNDFPINKEEALKWYRIAAEQGSAKAQLELGGMFGNGEGVVKDDEEAVKWYFMAAEQGNYNAQYELGLAYQHGNGVAKSETEAIKWYRKSSTDPEGAFAKFVLNNMYANGEGEPYGRRRLEWYQEAAEQGFEGAQYFLGNMYANGEGVPEDHAEAAKWHLKAAKQGHIYAQYNLGLIYGKDQGVSEDLITAYQWISVSASQGNEDAKSFKNALVDLMSSEQIAEAQKASTLCYASKYNECR